MSSRLERTMSESEKDQNAQSDHAKQVWSIATAAERRAVLLSAILLIIASLSWPHLLCWICDRQAARSFGEFFRDFVLVEFLALPLMALWPLKKKLKSWIYSPEARSSRIRLFIAIPWLLVLLILGSIYIPHSFFWLSKRALASTWQDHVQDALGFALSLLPQALAGLPYLWAMRRIHRRLPPLA